jgi:hypothetical protein
LERAREQEIVRERERETEVRYGRTGERAFYLDLISVEYALTVG